VYGFGDKLASIRTIGRSSSDLSRQLREPFGADGSLTPDADGILDLMVERCREVIETDRADLVITSFAPLHQLAGQLRERLDAAGYDEIPLVSSLAAGVAVATSMAALGLVPAKRSYPTDDLRAAPAWR
jgi:hypothetical protein